MMAGNPSWWNKSNMSSSQDHHHNQTGSDILPICPSLLVQYHEGSDPHRSTFSSLLSLNSSFADDDHQEQLPHSWSHLLENGLANEEHKFGMTHNFYTKKADNWEEQLIFDPSLIRGVNDSIDVTHRDVNDDHELVNDHQKTCIEASKSWSCQKVNIPVLSPKSSVNLLDFPSNKRDDERSHIADHSSEYSTSTGGVSKKARVLPSLKVRKEKLGDKITALHQLVSPFGKTDTASVLLEVIGYIRFLQGQIEALSSPYLCNSTLINMSHQQLGKQDSLKDLKSKGLCLVPLSCACHVGEDDEPDYSARCQVEGSNWT